MTQHRSHRARRLVIQDRSRLFRESLSLLLSRSGHWTVVTATDARELLDRVGATGAVAVLAEHAAVPWDADELAARLREREPTLRLVGTVPPRAARQVPGPLWTLVPRTASADTFDTALRSGEPGADVVLPPRRRTMPSGLSGPELQVLVLISGGLTSSEIARHMRTSRKAVDNRRQSLFAKLGVQSQSQAVAVAVRTGILGPATRTP